jgi:hypothetical protein|tara:strand:- start:291 stop:530 length:240 start_codon:yes stop_codon:yes gene_type:complete
MDKKFLESKIENSRSMNEYRRKELVGRKSKVEALEPSKDILKDVYNEELKWVVYLENAIMDEEKLLDIFYTARDCTSTK